MGCYWFYSGVGGLFGEEDVVDFIGSVVIGFGVIRYD